MGKGHPPPDGRAVMITAGGELFSGVLAIAFSRRATDSGIAALQPNGNPRQSLGSPGSRIAEARGPADSELPIALSFRRQSGPTSARVRHLGRNDDDGKVGPTAIGIAPNIVERDGRAVRRDGAVVRRRKASLSAGLSLEAFLKWVLRCGPGRPARAQGARGQLNKVQL